MRVLGELKKLLREYIDYTRLGPLERKMLEQVWSRGDVTVRELVDAGNKRLAYTTIMTTLDRLFKKGLLQRTAEGKAFRYSPSCTPEAPPSLKPNRRPKSY